MSLVGIKNQTQLTQCFANKHQQRCGINLWILHSSVGKYFLAFCVYGDAKSDGVQKLKIMDWLTL